MGERNGFPERNIDPLSYEITRNYPGKYIIYSEDEQRVIGAGDTAAEASRQAEASGVGGLWHYGYGEIPEESKMDEGSAASARQVNVLAEEIRRQYQGKVIVYSEDEKRVIGVGETDDEAFDQAEASGVGGTWHVHYAGRPGEEGI